MLSTILSVVVLSGCSGSAGSNGGATSGSTSTPTAEFNADSAMAFVRTQTAFGPRVPGSAASQACAQWLVEQLAAAGADSIVSQHGTVTAYTGERLPITNITAQVNPSATKRILLLAHWDSRPWADRDENAANRNSAILGANDGASGVAVILEIVRQLGQQPARVGVDILLVDAEDYGPKADDDVAGEEDFWALGTQYWLEHPTLDLRRIRYAVLLDMVGGIDAVFPREYFSQAKAGNIVDRYWRQAAKSGYGDRFPGSIGGAITDDHIFLQQAGIPAIDIIESANPETGSFNPTWHTAADTPENISAETLKAVGQTVLNQIYAE